MTFDLAPRIVKTSDGREVGYRRLGAGPPVALLHASPRSAAALLPLAWRLADRFTVFAFDNPGFGYSDGLPIARPDAWDFGDALIGAFDSLGIERAAIYGSHTGAAIAIAAALSHPERVSALALDGYGMFTPREQAEATASYLAPIRPDWEGAWLAWLWSRVKDQFTFYPWYLRGQSARLPRPLAPLEPMQDVIVDFLAAGDRYRAAYASAFRFPGGDALRQVAVPCTVMARSDDLLFDDLDALTGFPESIEIRRLAPDDVALANAVAEALARGASGAAAAAPMPKAGPPGYAVVRVEGGTIGVLRSGAKSGRPIALLPGIPGSARGSADLARALGQRRPVLAVDLPGFGASSLADGAPIAAAIHAALAQLGADDFDAVAIGESASFACSIGGGRIVLVDPVPDALRVATVEAMADISPVSSGAHLLTAWHQLRDASLWRPWFARGPETALDAGTDPDVSRLVAILTDWMRGGVEGRRTLAAALAEPLAGRLPVSASIVAGPPNPRAQAAAILERLA